MSSESVVRHSFLGQANPLAKLVAVLLLSTVLTLSLDGVSATVVLVATLAVIPLAGVNFWTIVKKIWPLWLAIFLGVWGTALAGVDSGQILLNLGYATISTGSLTAGVALGIRGVALALPAVLLTVTTDPSDLAAALVQKAHLPVRFVMGALAAMRLLGLMVEEWNTLSLARRARGVGAAGSWWSRIRANLGQAFVLLVQAVRRATRLAVTMEARGFGGKTRTWVRESRFSWRDAWVLGFGVTTAALAVIISVATGAWNVIWLPH